MAPLEPMQAAEIEPVSSLPKRFLAEPLAAVSSIASSIMSRGSRSSSSSSTGRKAGAWNVARRTLGIGLLLVTVFLWTTSNFLASYIFSDHTYDKPFFVVYINTSIFAFSMIPITIKYVAEHGGWAHNKRLAIQTIRDWRQNPTGAGSSSGGVKTQAEQEDATARGRLLYNADDDNDDDSEDNDISNLEELSLDDEPAEKQLGFAATARLSAEFAPIWFLGNYFASACLEYTSVGSVTILTSTSSVWTLVFCALLRIDPFSLRKLIGVLASLTGIIMVSMVDLSSGGEDDEGRGSFPHKSRAQIAIGDAMAFFSAVVYGVYVVVMKVRVGNEDRVNMPLFFGLVGIFNIVFLCPLFPILHFTGIEPFELPPNGKIWSIIMLNSISSFISDVSWAYAMLLTTPLVVTVGLSLTIPLSLIGEMIQYNQYSSFVYWIGAGVVLLSFIFINHESKEDEAAKSSTADGNSTRSAVP
ncbi:hypothetical protein F4780DRAFT_763681 [Xylariomycetidae sp. FL0641]|nr:hypothetical protein F4780DRAFT_763681 [Xylariomycetidae sp. FL0641]